MPGGEIPFQFGVPAVNRPNPGHDDNIVAGGEPVLLQAVDFPQPAAHSVPDHGVPSLVPVVRPNRFSRRPFFRQYRTMVGETALRPLA